MHSIWQHATAAIDTSSISEHILITVMSIISLSMLKSYIHSVKIFKFIVKYFTGGTTWYNDLWPRPWDSWTSPLGTATRVRAMTPELEMPFLISVTSSQQCRLVVVTWWHQQNQIICKKQRKDQSVWSHWSRRYRKIADMYVWFFFFWLSSLHLILGQVKI